MCFFYSKGLDFLSTEFVLNSTFQSQIVFYNLTSVFNVRRGICFNCSVDIVMLVHTELVNEVGLKNSLVNATGDYSDLSVMVHFIVSTCALMYSTKLISSYFLNFYALLK